MCEEYERGASSTALATKYGVTDTTVRARIRAAGMAVDDA